MAGEEPDERCPICGEAVAAVERRGPVTFELRPCGHRVDDQIYLDRFCAAT